MFDHLGTEGRNDKSQRLDEISISEVLTTMNEEDLSVPEAVKDAIPAIEPLVKEVIHVLQREGRLIYVGAGTSGRLGVLDAVECRPTFGVPSSVVIGQMAGGSSAFTEAVEGAEDSPQAAAEDLKEWELTSNDVVIGLAASGRTPYVVGALQYARRCEAVTGSVACNVAAVISEYADYPIEVNTGAEVLTGSTRLKAGTAQKLVLNMISTSAMVGIGKVYENLMVDVQATNEKLYKRSHRIIMEATGVEEETAVATFEASGQHVKTAIVMILADVTAKDARNMLNEANGFIKKAIRGGA
ncbi:N-acetylmuramic acid 6-phosphate etherase [Natribacillus halophilus]|uniref:N-acetylmuramic acid 6-phosphate etherase n=1 Tax=Natribacillus halophilus TaxID=549003 RepID=A0A1G8L098_9BACI|nr:N-acetylmuramic acid 6-phosphate etherase [Natribacillus halophilus]SDI48580.1 N-acetylmuramic acid 6-phosphate etherase [Natribacillus halophilus]